MIKKFSHTVTTLVSMLLLAALVVVIPSTARAADGDPVAGYDYTFYVNDVRTRQDRSPGDGACVSSANAAKTVTQYVDTSGCRYESCSFLAAVTGGQRAAWVTAKILIVPASQVWVPPLSGSNWVNNSSAGSWQTNANVKLELDNDPGHNSADMVASGSLGSLTGGVDNAGGSGATIRVRYLFCP